MSGTACTVWSLTRWVTAERFQLVHPLHRTSYDSCDCFLDYCYQSSSGLRLLRSIEITSTSASHLWIGIK